MRRNLICVICTVMLAACAYGAQRAVLLPAAAKVSPEIRAHIQNFEEICIPFALHETSLTKKEDMDLNSRQMTELGYETFKRPRNCMAASDALWHATQEFKLASDESVDVVMIWPQKRADPLVPGGSCAYAFPEDVVEITQITTALKNDDERWGPLRPIGALSSKSEKISKPQFTVFAGMSERKHFGYSGQRSETLLQLFDIQSGLTFTVNRRFQYDDKTDSVSDEAIVLKVKGENHDGQWAPFMPINCP